MKENVHVRGHSGNAHAELASYVAATVNKKLIFNDVYNYIAIAITCMCELQPFPESNTMNITRWLLLSNFMLHPYLRLSCLNNSKHM